MSGHYLSDRHMTELRGRIERGEQPWAEAFERIRANADETLASAPVSVREVTGSPWFRQDGVYLPGKDGVQDPDANQKCGALARQLSQRTQALAAAWRLAGDPRYAEKALDLIHTWTINRNTYMFPSGGVFDIATPGMTFGGDIVVFGCFNGFFLGCYLVMDYEGWNLLARAAVKRWVRDMLAPQRELMFYDGAAMYNNWEAARLRYLVKGALVLDDLDLMAQVFDRWRRILPEAMTDEGELHRETMRTKSMNYSLKALSEMTEIAEIARHHGDDLYDFEVGGRSLRRAFDYLTPYLLGEAEWPFQQIEPFEKAGGGGAGMAAFELAWARWGDDCYRQVLLRHNARPGGLTTLLHAAP